MKSSPTSSILSTLNNYENVDDWDMQSYKDEI